MPFSYTFDNLTGRATISEESTLIPREKFNNRSEITSATIPDSVTKIGNFAFAGTKLREIVIPDSVTKIGYSAFNSCKLTSVVIPDSISTIDSATFSGNKIKEIVIPDSVSTIGGFAFAQNRLTSVDIPDGVTFIGKEAFLKNRLASVYIPDGVTTIEKRAFSRNKLAEVVIPDGVTTIAKQAFFGNELTEVVIPDSVTSIHDKAFSKNNITKVTLPLKFKDKPPYKSFDSGVEFSYSDPMNPTPEPTDEPKAEPIPIGVYGELTEEGWTSSEDSGTWSENRDAATELNDIDGFSLRIRDDVTVDTRGGNDKLIVTNELGGGIEVKGTLLMGDGHDMIDVRTKDAVVGIENFGTIDMGNGDDYIYTEVTKVIGQDEDALINHKVLNMGDGDDVIDARNGGLGGNGQIEMGDGDDEFSGFGDMSLVDGGEGQDKLRLGRGVYSVIKKGTAYRVAKGIGNLDIKNFELVGSFWSREDEFVELDFNKDQFAMVIDHHGVTFS
jgi:hypothetical protein